MSFSDKLNDKINGASKPCSEEIPYTSEIPNEDIESRVGSNNGIIAPHVVQPQTKCNSLIGAIEENIIAVQLAQESFNDKKKQNNMALKIEKVADDNFKAELEEVKIKVAGKEKDNKVNRQEIKNELLKLKQDAIFLKREQLHKLKMQKLKQRKEKYGSLLERYKIDYLPNSFVLFWILFLDGLVSCLNAISKVLSGINKTFAKSLMIILIAIFIFVAPVREWLFGLISGG